MKWNTEYFGFRLLVFVGFCGEVPVALLRKTGGCYDYRRRVVTELVRTGYLKERKFRGERRHVIRSLSLTSRGLNQIQHLSPGRAEQIRARLLAPADGQGDWRRTQRLHRNAACLLLAHQLGARWVPGRRRDDARRKELVYYSAYELNKVCGKDNKSARVSGVLLTPGGRYYALYYLGRRNMRWNPETELLFRDQFEQSEAGAGFSYSGSILLGEAWEQAADLVPHALNPRSRLIRFAREDFFYYIAFDANGRRLLRAILDEGWLYRLQQYLLREAHCPVTNEPVYLFPLELLAGFYQPPGERQYHVRQGLGWFFDFQMPAMERLCNTGAELVSLPDSLLAGLDRKEGSGMDREKIITAAELMDMQFLPRSTVVDGMLPAGCYILAGAPKVGKSFLMAQLCWCVATGIPFLGQPTRRSHVLYLSLEDTGERVQGRLIRMFGVEHPVGRLHLKFETDLRGRDLLAMLEGFFMDHPSVRLVVIDTFQRVREGGGAQYSYQSDYEEIRPFKEFTDIHDVALILVHHTRKNTESENSFDRISGTNGLLGAADGAFLLYREKGRVILDQTGRDLPGQRMILDFDSQRCLWTVVSREAEIAEPPEPLLDLIDQAIGVGWQGTATELLERLRRLDPELPYRANTLTRKLNALTRRLKEEKGIEYWKSRRPESRQLTFLRTEDEEEDEEHDGDDDDDDSAPAREIPSLLSLGSESGGDGDG